LEENIKIHLKGKCDDVDLICWALERTCGRFLKLGEHKVPGI
jgi:hypothetical protein